MFSLEKILKREVLSFQNHLVLGGRCRLSHKEDSGMDGQFQVLACSFRKGWPADCQWNQVAGGSDEKGPGGLGFIPRASLCYSSSEMRME